MPHSDIPPFGGARKSVLATEHTFTSNKPLPLHAYGLPLAALLLAPSATMAENTATLPPVTVQAPQPSAADASTGQHSSLYQDADLGVAHKRTVDDILRGEPGIATTKGGTFGLGFLYLRGAGGQGLLTLDGMPVPDTLPGVVNLNALLPDGMESVEVKRGFGSASRAFSSLGGSIDLTSREARDDSADLRVEAGTFAFLKETARANLAGDKGRIAVTVNRSDAFDGAYHAQKDNGNPERDRFHGNQTLMRAGLDLSQDVTWEGSMFYRDSWNGFDGYGFRNGRISMVDEKGSFFAEESWMAQNSLKARINADWTSRLQVGYTHTNNYSRVLGIAPGYTTDLYLARWENDQRLWHGEGDDSIRLIWGAEGRHEQADAPTYNLLTLASGAPFAEHRSQQSGFLETRFVHGKLSGDVGVRYESYDRFGSHALLHAGAAWQMLPTLKLRANGGNGFRIPSYAEKLFPLLGNLALKPERGAGGDLGLEWQALSRLKLNLSGFYTRYDNLMVVHWNLQPSASIPCIGECISNIANATIAGMEAAGEFTFNEQWRGGTAYTYTDSRDLDTGKRIPFRPKNTARIWGEWRAAALPVTVWAEGVYRGLTRNDLANALNLTDTFRVNAQVNYQVSPKLDLYVRGENLGNDKTPDAFSFDHPGAMVYGGVAWKL